MASKLVVFALSVLIYKVQSQTVGCYPNSQPPTSSNFQIVPSNSKRGIKASPQLQILPGQGNLKAIPISNLVAQPQGPQRLPVGCKVPRQSVQIPLPPQVPSPAQCPPVQPPCNPVVLNGPVSTIAIPPSCSTTYIDQSLCNSLANALQLLIANDFLNCAINNNIINQDGVSLPAVETCIPSGLDLSSIIRNLNANQLSQGGTCPPGSTGNTQTCLASATGQTCQPESTCRCNQPDVSCETTYDWEYLLERIRDSQCGQNQYAADPDWAIILDYINSQIDRSDSYDRSCDSPCSIEIEPENSYYDYSPFINYLKQRGQTGAQIAGQCQPQNCNAVQNYQQPAYAPSIQTCDTDRAIIEALLAYLGCNSDVSSSYPSSVPARNNYPITNTGPNVAEVLFPEEIPAQLICNLGYLPTSVPVVSFSVQPVDPSCNFGVSQCQIQ